MSSTNFVLEPTFAPELGGLTFDVDRINAFMRAEYNDNFGFYQQNFGVYNYMQLTKDLQYKIHYMEGTPLLWQPHNSCSWDPMGNVQFGDKTITPCKAKMNVENCYDEMINTIYKAFLSWDASGRVDFDPQYIPVVNEFVRTIGANATLGARLTLTAGQLYDGVTEAFTADLATDIQSMFKTSVGVCQGWIDLLEDSAATYSWLDGSFIDAADISSDGTQWVGDSRTVLDLYDETFAGAPQALQDAIIEGGIGGFGAQFFPLWLVSSSVWRAVDAEYKVQRATTATNLPRIEVETFQTQTPRGSRPVNVYKIDNTYVIPIHDPNHFTKYLTGTSHFQYLTLSGVVQLGTSFASLPVVGQSDVGMMVQISNQAEDLGKQKMVSHALFGTAINDVDYIAGNHIYAEPA